MSVGIREVTDHDWEQIVEKNILPVFVLFYSPACGHCLRVLPSIETVSRNYSKIMTFVKINVLTNNWLAERYGVMATPAFLGFCSGKVIQTRIGAVYPSMIKK